MEMPVMEILKKCEVVIEPIKGQKGTGTGNIKSTVPHLAIIWPLKMPASPKSTLIFSLDMLRILKINKIFKDYDISNKSKER